MLLKYRYSNKYATMIKVVTYKWLHTGDDDIPSLFANEIRTLDCPVWNCVKIVDEWLAYIAEQKFYRAASAATDTSIGSLAQWGGRRGWKTKHDSNVSTAGLVLGKHVLRTYTYSLQIIGSQFCSFNWWCIWFFFCHCRQKLWLLNSRLWGNLKDGRICELITINEQNMTIKT